MMNNRQHPKLRLSLLALALLSSFFMPSLAMCPTSCTCMDAFVVCDQFEYLDLALLPPGIDSLVLSDGKVEEFPAGFLAMATDLKILDIKNVSARMVRGSAFRGLSGLELLSITESSFDIVEPDAFSGLNKVNEFLISKNKFGRVGKHAFGFIEDIDYFRIWNNKFKHISDEAFYKLYNIHVFQLYQNSITFLGNDVFQDASEIGMATIYTNKIDHVSEGSFEHMAGASVRMVLYANKFMCSCELAWMLTKPQLSDYLSSNECTFPGHPYPTESTFRMSDLTKEVLCATVPSTSVIQSTKSGIIDIISTESTKEGSPVPGLVDIVDLYSTSDSKETSTDSIAQEIAADEESSFYQESSTVSPSTSTSTPASTISTSETTQSTASQTTVSSSPTSSSTKSTQSTASPTTVSSSPTSSSTKSTQSTASPTTVSSSPTSASTKSTQSTASPTTVSSSPTSSSTKSTQSTASPTTVSSSPTPTSTKSTQSTATSKIISAGTLEKNISSGSFPVKTSLKTSSLPTSEAPDSTEQVLSTEKTEEMKDTSNNGKDSVEITTADKVSSAQHLTRAPQKSIGYPRPTEVVRHAKPYSTSALGMRPMRPGNASPILTGNRFLVGLICGVIAILVSGGRI